MSGDDATNLPALPDDIAELVAGARRIEDPPAEVRARLRARLGPPPPPSGGGGDAATAPVRGLARLGRAPWWAVVAAFIAGIGAGRGTAPSPVPSLPPVAEGASAIRTAPEAPPLERGTAASDLPDAPRAHTQEAPTPRASSAAIASATAASDLAAERRLLAIAKTALGRDDGSNALLACEDHARRFPHGSLAEEREALAVEALVQSKRSDEAKTRAARFEHAYPKSILLPAVRAAIESDPR